MPTVFHCSLLVTLIKDCLNVHFHWHVKAEISIGLLQYRGTSRVGCIKNYFAVPWDLTSWLYTKTAAIEQ